ncbi:cell division protein FtsK, partial [Streptomyces sp. W16]|nr:cell division protein FtsK [Streptomyces sp. W16]
RVRLAAGTPALAARVRVLLDGSAQLLMTDGALLDGKPAQAPSPWREGSQLAVGDILLELTSQRTARAPLTPAQDGLGLEFNRPPRFLPPAAGAKFRLPTPPVKPDKRPIPLLPILLVPAASAVIAIFVTHRWSFVFIALLSPIAALITQFGGRKQAMLKYLEKKEEYEQTLARVRADVDAAVLGEQHNLRLSLPDPAMLLQMAVQPSERLWERRWQDPDFLSVRVGTADLPSSISVDDPDQDEHRRSTVPTLNQVPVNVALRRAGVAGVAG